MLLFTGLGGAVLGVHLITQRPSDEPIWPNIYNNEPDTTPLAPTPFTPPGTAAPKGDRILLVVMDTVPADRMGLYGYNRRKTTPGIDRLARNAIVFDRFHAISNWTAPAMATILTGTSPTVHNLGWRLKKADRPNVFRVGKRLLERMSKKVPTIAQRLKHMESGAVVNNPYLHPVLGLSAGFDYYDYQKVRLVNHRLADQTTDDALKWLRKNGNQPFFFMVHYMDPHQAYNPPARYHGMLEKNRGQCALPFARSVQSTDPVSDDDINFIRSAYDGELRFVDDQVSRLVDELDKLPFAGTTWVVITSDHGEEHFEHGGFEHGHTYYEELVHIPLIIRAPGAKWGAGLRVPTAVSQLDLVPTFLEWMNQPITEPMEGRSLMPVIMGKELDDRPLLLECNLYGRRRLGFLLGPDKLVTDGVSGNPAAGCLFNLNKDPFERLCLKPDTRSARKLAALMKQTLKMRRQLKKRLVKDAAPTTQPGGPTPQPVSDEIQQALKSLGYIAR